MFTDYLRIRNDHTRWSWLGPLLTASTLGLLHFLDGSGYRIPNSAPIYFCAIGFCAFLGGLGAGFASALLVFGYSLYVFASPGGAYSPDNFSRLIVLAITCPVIALLVGTLKDKYIASEQRLLLAMVSARAAAVEWDSRTGRLSFAGGPLSRSMNTFETLDELLARVEPAEAAAFRHTIKESARARAPFDTVLKLTRPDKTTQWVDVAAEAAIGSRTGVFYLRGVIRDVTAKTAAERHRDLLIYEIAHRSRNQLTVLQSIAELTLEDDIPVEQARRTLRARFAAVGRSNDMLTGQKWVSLPLAELLKSELTPYADRLDITADPLELNAAAAQALCLFLHELVTNALKYGALSQSGARVRIVGRIGHEDGREVLVLTWDEYGGPPVSKPERRGYGSVLIEALVEGLSGTTRVAYRPDGISVALTIPTEDLRPPKAATDVVSHASRAPGSSSSPRWNGSELMNDGAVAV